MKLKLDLTQKPFRKLFFTADFHLFHHNVIRFDKRPFDNINEMHNAIVDGWNEVVGKDDIVIFLGDLSLTRVREDKEAVKDILSELNGIIHYVMGNHDEYAEIKALGRFQTIQDYLEVKVTHPEIVGLGSKMLTKKESTFCCFHYPIYSWNKGHYGTYHIHGHCHGNLHHGEDASYYTNRRAIDVGCMLTDYKPISYIEVIEKLELIELPKLTRTND
jgi:calcineurin-like phosphoesterase family protein